MKKESGHFSQYFLELVNIYLRYWLLLNKNMRSSQKRLLKELRDIQEDPITNCTLGPKNMKNLFAWNATIIGPEGSPYEGGLFKLDKPNLAPISR